MAAADTVACFPPYRGELPRSVVAWAPLGGLLAALGRAAEPRAVRLRGD